MSEVFRSLIFGLLCVGLVFLAMIGLIVLLVVNRNRSREKTAIHPDWPVIPGLVTAARVEESVRTRADDDVFYYPLIEFNYSVAGQVYKSSQAVGRSTNLEFKAKRVLTQYPPGAEVKVSYNPEKPGEARLLIK